MNIKLLREIRSAILKEPHRFDMEKWVTTDDEFAPCGTTACIAGWACVLSIKKKQSRKSWSFQKIGKFVDAKEFNSISWTQDEAERQLRANPDQTEALFFVDHWPHPFKGQYNKLKYSLHFLSPESDPGDLKEGLRIRKQMARVAAKRITAFINEHAYQ